MKRNKHRGEIFLQNKGFFIFLICKKWRRGQNSEIIALDNSIMELHNAIYKTLLISNYANVFELWGSIKLTHRISCLAILMRLA